MCGFVSPNEDVNRVDHAKRGGLVRVAEHSGDGFGPDDCPEGRREELQASPPPLRIV